MKYKGYEVTLDDIPRFLIPCIEVLLRVLWELIKIPFKLLWHLWPLVALIILIIVFVHLL